MPQIPMPSAGPMAPAETTEALEPSLRRSFLLFGRPSREAAFSLGELMASRAPHAWKETDAWTELWSLGDRGLAAVARAVADGHPLLWGTPSGVARLVPLYAADAGAWLLAHVSLSSGVARRLVAELAARGEGVIADAMGEAAGKSPTLRRGEAMRLSSAWRWLMQWEEGFLPLMPGADGMDASEVEAAIDRMARTVGCAAVCCEIPDRRLDCHLPRLLEATLLSLLCHARALSPTRSLTYTLRAGGEGTVAPLSLRVDMACMLPDADTPPDRLLPGLVHLRRVTEVQGGVCLVTWSEPYAFGDAVQSFGRCRDLTVTLAYPQDPTREPWSDFKHPERTLR